MMKGRNLVALIGIPSWLLLIWKGDLYYSIFILICMALALGEFYSLMEKNNEDINVVIKKWVASV